MGFIYILTNGDNNENCYIGSTKRDINNRIKEHKNRSKKGINETYKKMKDWDFKIRLLEECDDTILKERERYYIENHDCINLNIPNRSSSEYYKEKNKICVNCECGGKYRFGTGLSGHLKTKKHLKTVKV